MIGSTNAFKLVNITTNMDIKLACPGVSIYLVVGESIIIMFLIKNGSQRTMKDDTIIRHVLVDLWIRSFLRISLVAGIPLSVQLLFPPVTVVKAIHLICFRATLHIVMFQYANDAMEKLINSVVLKFNIIPVSSVEMMPIVTPSRAATIHDVTIRSMVILVVIVTYRKGKQIAIYRSMLDEIIVRNTTTSKLFANIMIQPSINFWELAKKIMVNTTCVSWRLTKYLVV